MNDGDASYFDSYTDLEVHRKMLHDTCRNEAYREAVYANEDYFRDKVVLDVGAGTGILSVLCAKAGAAKVYAVEASSITTLTEAIILENEVQNIVQVLRCKVEELQLPEKVDVIISEWMGFYLFHESMLDSILVARDKFLKEDGVLFPSKCELFAAPCKLPDFFTRWNDVSTVKMNAYAAELRKTYAGKPRIMRVPHSDLFAQETSIGEFHLKYIEREELNDISQRLTAVSRISSPYQGLCIWFTVTFPSLTCNAKEVVLSTAPDSPKTHWKQTVLVLQDDIETEEGDLIVGNLSLKRSPVDQRFYDIVFEVLDPEEEEHPIPCYCYDTRCKIVRALSDQYDKRDLDIEDGVD